jgi:hypothetical protein
MDGTRVSGYGLSVIRSLWFFTFLLGAFLGVGAGGDDFASALERAREAGISHRYAEVIEILTPFNAVEDSETRYCTRRGPKPRSTSRQPPTSWEIRFRPTPFCAKSSEAARATSTWQ